MIIWLIEIKSKDREWEWIPYGNICYSKPDIEAKLARQKKLKAGQEFRIASYRREEL